MKVIVNKFIPFHGYVALTFYNIIFWRKEYEYKIEDKEYYDLVYNHESIHNAQMKDFCPWVPIGGSIFYLIYILEWGFRLLFTKDFMNISSSYKHISFEKEAYKYENDYEYLKNRKKFAEWR